MIWLSLLCAITAAAADVTGLRQQSEVKITAQMAGAPFEGEPSGETIIFHKRSSLAPCQFSSCRAISIPLLSWLNPTAFASLSGVAGTALSRAREAALRGRSRRPRLRRGV